MHLAAPTHIYLFWMRCHPNRTFLPIELEREPKNRFSFLPTARPHLSYLWPVAHFPCIGWIQVNGVWALCACPTSIWVHCFSGFHAFAIAFRIWYLFNSCGINEFLGLHSLHLISSSGWILLECGLSLLNSAHVPFFLPFVHGLARALAKPLHCSCYDIIHLFLPCYFFWAYGL